MLALQGTLRMGRRGCGRRRLRRLGQFAGAHHARDRGQGPEAWPLNQSIGHDGLPRRPGPQVVNSQGLVSVPIRHPPPRLGQARRGTKHATEERTARWTSAQCYGARYYGASVLRCSCATELTTLRYDLSRDAQAAQAAQRWVSITRRRPHVQGDPLRAACNLIRQAKTFIQMRRGVVVAATAPLGTPSGDACEGHPLGLTRPPMAPRDLGGTWGPSSLRAGRAGFISALGCGPWECERGKGFCK
ncbi:hypothetical protein EDB80DRAFT_729864 [Ilyonectria destructans]|nr:hypothetical protein EDB80DRAFT_729864 [Ilyonectria destructans]